MVSRKLRENSLPENSNDMTGIEKLKKLKLYLALHIFLMIYATSSIFSKLAAGKPFMSLPFIFLYGIRKSHHSVKTLVNNGK